MTLLGVKGDPVSQMDDSASYREDSVSYWDDSASSKNDSASYRTIVNGLSSISSLQWEPYGKRLGAIFGFSHLQ
jgi:hypothetical protein